MNVVGVLRQFKRDVNMLRSGENSLYYFGEFPSWDDAEQESAKYGKSYQSDNILGRVAEATQAVRRGEALYEQDSVLFYEQNNNYELIAALLYVYANRNSLRVIDFGGALGSTYFRYRGLLSACNPIWEVVEQAHYVDYGQINVPEIRFNYTIDECDGNADVILFSSVLMYLKDPYATLAECLSKGVEYVIIDETAFSWDDREKIVLQNVPDSIYKAVYPLHLFSYGDFLKFVEDSGYEVLWDWDYRYGKLPMKKGFHFIDTIEKAFLLRRKMAER